MFILKLWKAIAHERNNEQNRIYEDLITLCHLDHRGIHKAMERVTNADGRQGWKSNPRIPTVHAFNINGFIEHKEVKNNDQ